MNFLFTTILVAIVACSYGAHIQSDSREEMLALVEEKCNSNAHNKVAFRNLVNAFEPFTECIQGAMGYPVPHPLDDYAVFCERLGNGNYYTCLNNFAKKVSPCLDQDESYLPNFVLSAYNASLAEYCGENGLNKVTAVTNDISSSNCITNHLSPEALQNRCFLNNNLVILKNIQNGLFTIKKDDLCSDLRSLKGCIIDQLQERCHEDHSETVNFLIDPYLTAC